VVRYHCPSGDKQGERDGRVVTKENERIYAPVAQAGAAPSILPLFRQGSHDLTKRDSGRQTNRKQDVPWAYALAGCGEGLCVLKLGERFKERESTRSIVQLCLVERVLYGCVLVVLYGRRERRLSVVS